MKRRDWVYVKPGWKPSKALIDRIKRLYPTIRLVWNRHHRRWGIVDHQKNGRRYLVRWIDRPGMNVLRILADASILRRLHRARVQAWIEKSLNEPEEKALDANQSKISEQWAEGSDRMWSRFGPDHTVAFSDGKAARRKNA